MRDLARLVLTAFWTGIFAHIWRGADLPLPPLGTYRGLLVWMAVMATATNVAYLMMPRRPPQQQAKPQEMKEILG